MSARWQPELVDLTRPLTEETVWALLGDLADGEPAPLMRTFGTEPGSSECQCRRGISTSMLVRRAPHPAPVISSR